MKVVTHITCAEAAWFATATLFDLEYGAGAIVAAGAASLLPDADYPKSWTGYMLGSISDELHERFGHRSFLHSVAALGLFGLALYPLALAGLGVVWIAALIGYASHLGADMMTLGGVQLFYPSRGICVFPGRDEYRVLSGGRSERVFFGIVLAIACLLYPISQSGMSSMLYGLGEGEKSFGTVAEVIDGDTIVVERAGGLKETVRLIGVDTPETVAPDQPVGCFGPEASEYTKDQLSGRLVELVRPTIGDPEDAYGRTLAYVYRGGTGTSDPATSNFNAALLEGGYARAATFDHEHRRIFEDLADQASDHNLGLWEAC